MVEEGARCAPPLPRVTQPSSIIIFAPSHILLKEAILMCVKNAFCCHDDIARNLCQPGFFHTMKIEKLLCIFFSHPYMEKPRPPIPAAAGTIGQVTENRRRQQGPPPSYPRQPQAKPTPITTTTRAPPVQVKRILALPIISSSYASTNYQGGSTRYGHTFTHVFLCHPFVKEIATLRLIWLFASFETFVSW